MVRQYISIGAEVNKFPRLPGNDGAPLDVALALRRRWHEMCTPGWVMPSQKTESDLIGRIARIAGLVLLAGLIMPPVHRMLARYGLVATGLSVSAVLALLGFGIYRWLGRHGGLHPANDNPFASPSRATGPDVERR